MPENIPDGIDREDVLKAIVDFDNDIEHGFFPSTGYDLHFNDCLYPPKAILGLAARRTAGRILEPEDFSGGEDSKCFRVLRELGFVIKPKADIDRAKKRNPAWERDETILALELYFRYPPSGISQDHEEVVQLSELLNRLPIHKDKPTDTKFRNPNGVYMNMCNFLAVDPSYGGKGLGQGSKLDQVVWDEFANRREDLRMLAEAIASGYSSLPVDIVPFEDDEDEFPEGRILYRMHRTRERNDSVVKRAKKKAMETSNLVCVVCEFDFFDVYGEIGRGFIECHHTRPISEYKEGEKTKEKDLALVCANCHRMIAIDHARTLAHRVDRNDADLQRAGKIGPRTTLDGQAPVPVSASYDQ